MSKLSDLDHQVLDILGQEASVDRQKLWLLNPGAPNSWSIHDRKNNEVWKIIKPNALKYKDKLHKFLEKEAIDKIPDSGSIIKYKREGTKQFSGLARNGKNVNLPFLVFPFVEGEPLDIQIFERVKANKTFSAADIQRVVTQLVKAVHTMYKSGVIHQDIKPGNIILDKNGDVHVLDLGISQFVDEDLRLVKRMAGPYAYLSPERLDMISDLSNENKRKMSFASDLFSIGMIAFEMATLKRVVDLVEPGDIRRFSKKIGEFKLEDSLERIIGILLQESPLDRQKLSSKEFGLEWFEGVEDKRISWWIQHQSNGWDFISEFITDNKKDNSESNIGVILSADQNGRKETFSKKTSLIRASNARIAIDPATYRLAYDDVHHSYLRLREYGYIVSPGLFTEQSIPQKKRGENFIKQVFEFQRNFDPDILIAPYFSADTDEKHHRWVDANFGAWRMALDYYTKESLNKPLYFGIVLSEKLVSSKKDLESIVQQVLLDTSIKNVYLRIESVRKGSAPNKNVSFLENVRDMIKTLSPSKKILYVSSDVEVFGYFGDGLSSFAINPDYEKRKQRIFDKYGKPEVEEMKIDWDKRRARYFAHKLWNDILAETELLSKEARALGSDKVLLCDCPYCFDEGKDQRLDPNTNRKHFLFHINKFMRELVKSSVPERAKKFMEKLEQAKEGYSFLGNDCNMKFDSETDGSFIDVWETIFTD